MKKTSWLGVGVVMLVLLLVGGAVLFSQSQESVLLRSQFAAARALVNEGKQVRAENERLRKEQISAAELEALRAEHVTVERLRSEVEALQTSVTRQEKALATTAQSTGTTFRRPVDAALTLAIEIGGNGAPWLDGVPLDSSVVRQRLAGVGRGNTVLVKMAQPKGGGGGTAENFRRVREMFGTVAKELGISLAITTERAAP